MTDIDEFFEDVDVQLEFEEFLNYIKTQDYYSEQISHIEEIPKREAQFGTLDTPLNKRLNRWLKLNDIGFWTHQAKAINLIRNGNNTVIATSTASGKSLCYNIPVIQSILEDPSSTALYIFPTKALARDQYVILSKFLSDTNIRQNRVGIYDGDIDQNAKRKVLDDSNIIITNPYGLHLYLPWFKRKWWRICKNLKYIVLDEICIFFNSYLHFFQFVFVYSYYDLMKSNFKY